MLGITHYIDFIGYIIMTKTNAFRERQLKTHLIKH